jgi:hypothetical protein
MATRTTPPPVTAIRPTRMNLRQLSILAASSSIWVAIVVVVHGQTPGGRSTRGSHAQRKTIAAENRPADFLPFVNHAIA